MATKEAVFKLRVDTGNSVADIDAADKAIQGFNKDLQQTKTIQSDSNKIEIYTYKIIFTLFISSICSSNVFIGLEIATRPERTNSNKPNGFNSVNNSLISSG